MTTHDSSLSAGIHAIVAAHLGKAEEAYAFWLQSSRIEHNTRIHPWQRFRIPVAE